ncbi:hypothetical protein DL89DRAFT_271272 [Linderina pennispora]|uniref:Uncharacterized protein n=1 Tax=Linderina pennispora TaxID=61395 RepID=A0A1Y1VW32_9FUNG|nr:uncharacterized protein DL89DRAFT_271272 [Linderina pennispora]ORX65196.1 hypothetical protein DL89DRAFT_271272 [Linderina pennispora]
MALLMTGKNALFRKAGVYVVQDSKRIIRKTVTDWNQDIEIDQGGWQVKWWSNKNNWDEVELRGTNNYKESFKLSKIGSGMYSVAGIACTADESPIFSTFCLESTNTWFAWLASEITPLRMFSPIMNNSTNQSMEIREDLLKAIQNLGIKKIEI